MENRVTPDRVKEALELTGLKLDDGAWIKRNKQSEPVCACALSQVLIAEKNLVPAEIEEISWFLEENGDLERIGELLDLPPVYILGFIYGFDDKLFSKSDDETFLIGQGDGQTCRKELLEND